MAEAAAPPDPGAVRVFRGYFVSGFSTGPGIIVLRPEYVAFLPTEPMKNLAIELPKGLAFAVAGLVELPGGGKIRLDEWIRELGTLSTQEHDELVLDMAARIGGTVWRRGETQLQVRNTLFSRHNALWFVANDKSIRAVKPLFEERLTR